MDITRFSLLDFKAIVRNWDRHIKPLVKDLPKDRQESIFEDFLTAQAWVSADKVKAFVQYLR
jgi:hypothetical protein